MSFSRVVCDNNLIVSAMISPQGTAARTYDALFAKSEVLISAPLLLELRAVAARRKFDRYMALSLRMAFLDAYELACDQVRIRHSIKECRDPKDNMLLELALSGGADLIVTGDKDLLCLHPWRGIAILSPADYLKAFRGPETGRLC
jgi:putative PIN family toxin of toxin-antitoxin system